MTARTPSSRCARIATGEEIRMDYGTFSFSFDHDFACRCGAAALPRQGDARNDWPGLVRRGLRLPGFMRALADTHCPEPGFAGAGRAMPPSRRCGQEAVDAPA